MQGVWVSNLNAKYKRLSTYNLFGIKNTFKKIGIKNT